MRPPNFFGDFKMGIFDKITQKALNEQREQLEAYYKDEDEYIRSVKSELRSRLDKSRQYRIMLQEYREKLIAREQKLIEREQSVKEKEARLTETITKTIMADLKKEEAEFQLKKNQLEEYELGLRKTEFTLIDWFKRVDRKEREIFDELLEDVNRYKKYTENIPQMDGFQFEEYVAGLLMKNGYENVVVTQKSRDYGADIVAERQEVKYVIQCKYYSSQVGIEAVQQIYAAKIHYAANVAIVATNSVYTRAAETLAKDLGVILWDGKELHDMFEKNES